MISTDKIDLVAIKFTYQNEQEQSAAVPLYQGTAPEYPKPQKIVVAYPIAKLSQEVKIYCCFQTTNQDLITKVVTVRAIVQQGANVQVIAQMRFTFWTDGFSASVKDFGFIPLVIDTTFLFGIDKQVSIFDSKWCWQWSFGFADANTNDWQTFAEMDCEFLLLLDTPTAPWGWKSNIYDTQNDVFTPYVGFVRHACEWAKGATTQLEACQAIVKGLMEQTKFEYALDPAYTKYEFDPETNLPLSPDQSAGMQFNGSALRERLHGWDGNGHLANCADLSHAIMLFANILGCNMKVGRLENSTQPGKLFALNEVYPLHGTDTVGESFRFHFVAYLGNAFDETALIFDACLQFPNGTDTPDYVLGMPLTEYIQKLAQNPADCIPQQYATQERIHLI